MAGWTEFESATFRVTGECSNQLSYHPKNWRPAAELNRALPRLLRGPFTRLGRGPLKNRGGQDRTADLAAPSRARCHFATPRKDGCSGWGRTSDQVLNRHLLCH